VHPVGDRLAALAVALATAIVLVTVAVLPFLTPQWVSFEQGRANAIGWTGYTPDELKMASNAILGDLVLGRSDFDVEVSGVAVLGEDERGHMRDVRSIFVGLWLLAAGSVVVLAAAGRHRDRSAIWRAVRRGAIGLALAIVVAGGVALVAFDVLFELFHQLLFPAGSYTFDPTTQRLVQLFPFQFWQETAIVAGVVIFVLALGLAQTAARRAIVAESGRRANENVAGVVEP
jgi:integral membrane protein (TIGR01906 family)